MHPSETECTPILSNLSRLYDLRQQKIEVVKINKKITEVDLLINHELIQDVDGIVYQWDPDNKNYVPISALAAATELPDPSSYLPGTMAIYMGSLYVNIGNAWKRPVDHTIYSGWGMRPIAYILDGTGAYIRISNNETLNVGENDFSIEHCFKLIELPASTKWILAKGGGGAAAGYGLIINSAGVLQLNLQNADGGDTFTIASGLVANQLYHVIVTVDRDGNAIGYINGEPGTPVSVSEKSGDIDNTHPLTIGSFSLGSDFTKQILYSTRVDSRVLTPLEVIERWNNGLPELFVVQNDDSCVMELLPSYAGQNIWLDAKNANHGTVIGSPVAPQKGVLQLYRDGIIGRDSNWDPADIIPPGYLLKRIIFHNTSEDSCTINVGSAVSGDTDIVNGAVVAGGAIVTTEINKLFSYTAAQSLFFESSSWEQVNITLIMEKQ